MLLYLFLSFFKGFASAGFCNPRYEMMTGRLLYDEPPSKSDRVPPVRWPPYNGSLQTAFQELMSTPSRVSALSTVGAWLCGFSRALFLFCFALTVDALNLGIFVPFSLAVHEFGNVCNLSLSLSSSHL